MSKDTYTSLNQMNVDSIPNLIEWLMSIGNTVSAAVPKEDFEEWSLFLAEPPKIGGRWVYGHNDSHDYYVGYLLDMGDGNVLTSDVYFNYTGTHLSVEKSDVDLYPLILASKLLDELIDKGLRNSAS